MVVFFISLMFFLAVIYRDIRLEAEAKIDFVAGSGGYKVKLFGIPIFYDGFCVVFTNPECPKIERVKRKIRRVVAKRRSIRIFMRDFFTVVGNLRIKKIDMFVHIGSEKDPVFTTLAMGGARIVFYALLSLLKTKYGSKVKEHFVPCYGCEAFKAAVYGKVYLSIADVLHGLCKLTILKIRGFYARRKAFKWHSLLLKTKTVRKRLFRDSVTNTNI